MRPGSRWQLGRNTLSEKGKCPLGPSLSIKYIYLEESCSLSTLSESWNCSRIAWRGEQSCDLQDICLRVMKDCKIKRSSYNRRFNQRNGEGSHNKFLKPNSRLINKYSSVWTEVPSKPSLLIPGCSVMHSGSLAPRFNSSAAPSLHATLSSFHEEEVRLWAQGGESSIPNWTQRLAPKVCPAHDWRPEEQVRGKALQMLMQDCLQWSSREVCNLTYWWYQSPRIRFPLGRHWGFQGCWTGFALLSLPCRFQMSEQRCCLPGAEGEKQPSLEL